MPHTFFLNFQTIKLNSIYYYLLLFNYHISHISFSVFFLPVAIFFPLFIFQLFLIFFICFSFESNTKPLISGRYSDGSLLASYFLRGRLTR